MASQRNAKIVTTIEVSEGGEVQVATSNAESEGEANIVTFIPATETNITNPRNGETSSKKLTSAVKRSIGFTIGFHGEGPY